jgi:branched-chain amino acid transport system ATP-binding protein
VTRLRVEDVAVRFGGHLALSGVTLDAEPGVLTGLIGPNGAGKTTLFNVICGLQAPQRGEVLLDGRDITRLAPFKRARAGLARTFQRLELFGLLSVRENVRLAVDLSGRGSIDAATDQLLERCAITAVADVRADRLPTGQARRVELARALGTSPTVLLLDEPASGQDDEETAEFGRLLCDVAAEGTAVVLVEHDMQLVMDVCEVIHVLDVGSIIASGPPARIRSDEAVLAAYLGTSTEPGA